MDKKGNDLKVKLENFITELKWEGTTSEAIISELRPQIAITTEETTDMKCGDSKLGGIPDVPKGFIWPSDEEGNLSFVCQYNCSQMQGYDGSEQLPKNGLILVFARADSEEAQLKYCVESSLQKATPPEDVEVLDEEKMTFHQFYSIPGSMALDLEGPDDMFVDDDIQTFLKTEVFGDEDVYYGVILGYPQFVDWPFFDDEDDENEAVLLFEIDADIFEEGGGFMGGFLLAKELKKGKLDIADILT